MRIGGELKEDWKRTVELEEHWRKVGGGLKKEEWRRAGGLDAE